MKVDQPLKLQHVNFQAKFYTWRLKLELKILYLKQILTLIREVLTSETGACFIIVSDRGVAKYT